MACTSAIDQSRAFICKNSCTSMLEGNVPFQREPMTQPARLNKRSQIFSVATTKCMSMYLDFASFQLTLQRLSSRSAKDIALSRVLVTLFALRNLSRCWIPLRFPVIHECSPSRWTFTMALSSSGLSIIVAPVNSLAKKNVIFIFFSKKKINICDHSVKISYFWISI